MEICVGSRLPLSAIADTSFRTPTGVAIGRVEEVDAGLEADVDEAGEFADFGLASGLETHLRSRMWPHRT